MALYNQNNIELTDGTASIVIPANKGDGTPFECGNYKVKISYDADESEEALEIVRNMVVGHLTNLTGNDSINPYATSAASESAITLTEKLNTAGSLKVTITDAVTGTPVQGIKFQYGVRIGDDTNYKVETSFDTRYEAFKQAVISPTVLTTDNNGQATIRYKLGDFFNSATQMEKARSVTDNSKTVNQHTLFICTQSTYDKAVNHRRDVFAIPFIVGATEIKRHFLIRPETDNPVITNTCCGGSIYIALSATYAFAYDSEGNILEGWEEYDTSVPKQVHVGKFILSVSYDNRETWEQIPASQLKLANPNYDAIINDDGSVTLSTNHTTLLLWSNDRDYSFNGEAVISVGYQGVIGKTKSKLGQYLFRVRINQNNSSYSRMESVIGGGNRSMTNTQNRTLNIEVKGKNNNARVTDGILTYVIKNRSGRTIQEGVGTLNQSNQFAVPITQINGVGEYDLTFNYSGSSVYEDSTKTVLLEIISSDVTLSVRGSDYDDIFGYRGSSNYIIIDIRNSKDTALTSGILEYYIDGDVVGVENVVDGENSLEFLFPQDWEYGIHELQVNYFPSVDHYNSASIIKDIGCMFDATHNYPPVVGDPGDTVVLQSEVLDPDGYAVEGLTGTIKVDGVLISTGVTDAAGKIYGTYTIPNLPPQTREVEYKIDGGLECFVPTGYGTVSAKWDTVCEVESFTAIRNRPYTLTARLVDAKLGFPLANTPVVFQYDSYDSNGVKTVIKIKDNNNSELFYTDSDGFVQVTFTPNTIPRYVNFQMNFRGNNLYYASKGNIGMTVVQG